MSQSKTMRAMVTMDHGGLDQIVCHQDWPCPTPGPQDVLIAVRACGLNNTDVNTRSGWYSKTVTSATTGGELEHIDQQDPTWGGKPIQFPRIQGADVCGIIVEVGADVDKSRIGERVITDNWLRDINDPANKNKTGYFGSECDGGYAEYTIINQHNALAVNTELSDAELATFSCSYSTAEGMLTQANVTDKDTILIPGASGGVGGALVQLAKLRGARVIAMASEAKHQAVTALGADRVLPRHPQDLADTLADETVTVIADIVGGPDWPQWIDCLDRGGRYVCSGAIAGPMVELDLRTLYLRDLSFFGSTVIGPEIMPNLVGYIERGEIRPLLAATYPLTELREAQAAFISKQHSGNIVVQP